MVSQVRQPIRSAIPLISALGIGLFLAVASHELSWSSTSTFVVAAALVAVLGFLGTPLAMLKSAPDEVDTRPTRNANDGELDSAEQDVDLPDRFNSVQEAYRRSIDAFFQGRTEMQREVLGAFAYWAAADRKTRNASSISSIDFDPHTAVLEGFNVGTTLVDTHLLVRLSQSEGSERSADIEDRLGFLRESATVDE